MRETNQWSTSQKNGQSKTAPTTPKKNVAAPPPAVARGQRRNDSKK